MERRDAAQILFIAMRMQAELMEALLEKDSISAQAALPMVAKMKLLISIWEREFPEGRDHMSEPLAVLDDMLAARENDAPHG